MKKALFCLTLATSSLLTGCIGPVLVSPVQTYTITYVGNPSMVRQAPVDKSLTVLPIKASRGFDSTAMIYQTKPYLLTSFGLNAWVAPPASLMSPLLLKALQNSGNFKNVVNGPAISNTDYTINTMLLELYQDFTVHPSEIVLSLDVDIVNNANSQVVADKVFTTRVKTSEENPYSGVVATNQAFNQLLNQITQFLTQQIRMDAADGYRIKVVNVTANS